MASVVGEALNIKKPLCTDACIINQVHKVLQINLSKYSKTRQQGIRAETFWIN